MGRRPLSRITLVVSLLLLAPVSARAQCGGLGQSPCYDWNPCAWEALGVCWGWWAPYGPWNGCNSSRLNNIGLFCAACGDTGQPTCQFEPACNQYPQRHTPFGLCYACGRSGQSACLYGAPCDPGNLNIGGICYYRGFASEPGTNTSIDPPAQPADQPLYGFAEVHIHPFANLGFGGLLWWGAPYDPRGINAALARCDFTWDIKTETLTGLPETATDGKGYIVHGYNNAGQWMYNPIEDDIGLGNHNADGTGEFTAWPRWNSVTHQQAYYKWIERAYQGGMRLMVMLAVNNEALCLASRRRVGFGCNDMAAADRQIAETKRLEAAIDQMHGGPGLGWFRIAYSPQQARQIVRSGKMAVVLGIEVDSLFGCNARTPCSDDYLRQEIQRYHNMGVRHVFPIHGFDNAFGGAALFNNQYNYANRIVNGKYFAAADCSAQGFGFNMGSDDLLGFADFIIFGITDQPPAYAGIADCNARPLTATGQNLVNALMDAKLIVDVDHMSFRMLEGWTEGDTHHQGVLEIAEARQYPLIASHASFFDLADPSHQSEFHRTAPQLQRIRNLGGIVAPMVPGEQCRTTKQYADILRYVTPRMTGGDHWTNTDGVAGVAFATDFMGAKQQTAPRFGPDAAACETQWPTTTMLTYPFLAEDGTGWIYQQQTGSRVYDFNVDGLAHVGLVPDLLADLRKTDAKTWGLDQNEMRPIFRSAEAYIRMWERIDASDRVPPPTITPQVTGSQGANGWYTGDVTIVWHIESETDIASSDGCTSQVVAEDTTGTVVTCNASNDGGGASAASVTIKRDTVPPVVTRAERLTPPNAVGWNNGPIEVVFEAADATSGLMGHATATVTVAGEGGGQTASHTFTDQAGLTTVASLGELNIDLTPPRVGFRFAHLPGTATPAEIEAEQARWHRDPVVWLVDADDALSGVASISPAAIELDANGLAITGSATAIDRAGNEVTASTAPVKIDRTPPSIAFDWRTPANVDGWNRTDVEVRWTCADSLSDVVEPAVSQIVGGEGADLSATGTCADVAGNETSATEEGVDIDRTPPTLAFGAPAPQPSTAGWHRTDVAWPFTPDDTLSGVASTSVSSPLVITGEGTGLTARVTVLDVAGNEAWFEAPASNIDRTPPDITFADRLPAANPAGWSNTAITVTWTCADALSGVVATSVAGTLATEGANQGLTGVCEDLAGNAASHVVTGLSVDKTRPVVACTAAPATLWPANHKMAPVGIALTFTDALSGTGGFTLTRASSSEPDNGQGDGDTPGDILGFVVGSNRVAGSLRAERSATGAGRVYTLEYQGFDRAGNSAACATVVAVPHDLGKANGKK